MKYKFSRPLIIFYILVVYIVIQFCWWGYHILRLQLAIHDLQSGPGVETGISDKILMVLGEGSVFLILLIIGVLITRNSFKKEAALGQQQKNFLLSVTHELRSPIASIKLYLETLLKRDLDKVKQTEVLTNTLGETERLLALVENLLFSAKIESGNFRLNKEKINVSELTSAVSALPVAGMPRPKKLYNHLDIDKDIFLYTDRLALVSIVTNLVENAVKYSPSDTMIGLKLKMEHGQVTVSVSDTGPGIPDGEKENIFKKFYRLGSEETRRTKGTGLGLYIVKKLTEQLGGTVTVRNNSPKGSVFEVTFGT